MTAVGVKEAASLGMPPFNRAGLFLLHGSVRRPARISMFLYARRETWLRNGCVPRNLEAVYSLPPPLQVQTRCDSEWGGCSVGPIASLLLVCGVLISGVTANPSNPSEFWTSAVCGASIKGLGCASLGFHQHVKRGHPQW